MSTTPEKLLEVKGIKLRFGDKVILNGVDFNLSQPEVLVIMGISGCGKSTLLKIILGLLKAQEGSVFFKTTDLLKLTIPQLNGFRKKIGMVYQNAALVSSLSVEENMALPLIELTEKTAQERDKIIDQKLELVGLKDSRKISPSELSGGMQKRVGLARALVLEPELILFDEPSSGLDPINSKLINDLIIQLRDVQKIASIVVTHEMQSAFAVANKMAFLHEGKIVLEGTPQDFRKSEISIIQQFIAEYASKTKTKDS